jgi:molybdopterin synthase catalytic subunit
MPVQAKLCSSAQCTPSERQSATTTPPWTSRVAKEREAGRGTAARLAAAPRLSTASARNGLHRPRDALGCRCVDFLLSPDPIPDTTPAFGPGLGAEARFLGVVRELEDGRLLTGIEYSAYRPMADKLLAELIARARVEREPHEAFLQHRLGFVAAGEPSILIRVRTRHSAAAFDLCRWYLAEIKARVPIWKKPVFAGPDVNPRAPAGLP